MKRDGKLTDVQLIVQQSDRQKNKIWKFTGVNPLALLVLVLGLASCASPKPTPTPSVEVTPSSTPTPTTTPSSTPTPKPSADAPRSETEREAPQSAGNAGDREQTSDRPSEQTSDRASDRQAEPEPYIPKEKAREPEKPQRSVRKPAPAIEPDIAPERRAEDPAPPQKQPIQMAPIKMAPIKTAPIAPEQDSDPAPPAR